MTLFVQDSRSFGLSKDEGGDVLVFLMGYLNR